MFETKMLDFSIIYLTYTVCALSFYYYYYCYNGVMYLNNNTTTV